MERDKNCKHQNQREGKEQPNGNLVTNLGLVHQGANNGSKAGIEETNNDTLDATSTPSHAENTTWKFSNLWLG